MHSFGSSVLSLPSAAASARAEKKSKRNVLRRLSLGKPRFSSDVPSSSTASLTSRSTVTLAVNPSEEGSSRRAFDLFSTPLPREERDTRSAPSTPRTSKAPAFALPGPSSKVSFDEKSIRSYPRSRQSLARNSTNSRFGGSSVPPVPELPKLVVVSNEVFVIAALPRAKNLPELPTSPLLLSSSSGSSRSSASWLDNLPTPSISEEAPALPERMESPPAPDTLAATKRSSLDVIDAQMITNLCEMPAPQLEAVSMARCKSSQGSYCPPRMHARSASQRTAPQASVETHQRARSHSRSGSAPQSLGPLPPRPAQPPTEAVLRKTDQIKKRYSRQGTVSPMPSPVLNDSAFSSPRSAPATPKLDTVAALKSLEAGLSLDSKLARRNHKRSSSRTGGATWDAAFKSSTAVRLTAGHSAARDEATTELVSRFSEDSDSGESSRLRALLSPVLDSVAKMPPLFGISTPSVDTHSSFGTRTNMVLGNKSPELPSLCISSSSSSSGSDHDHADLTPVVSIEEDDTIFDLSRPSMDYNAVYALAQQYAKASAPQPVQLHSMARSNSGRVQVQTKQARPIYLNTLWSKASRNLQDPVDRSYHLRK
ncbi:hypothetical protein PANT_9d00253 [Moesziomyces antarcticus T-34]|uniref:Uncharacterized protein n=1 Tax=Pseudozyma antarctica (strain T-34) TaxID=1151754 RepID=M9M188_PSEA3|nr:hypothetical protein PANT_9d00253 [Moesziomyces antarcticus T-34]